VQDAAFGLPTEPMRWDITATMVGPLIHKHYQTAEFGGLFG
jgi:hypothetical protein